MGLEIDFGEPAINSALAVAYQDEPLSAAQLGIFLSRVKEFI